MHPLALTAVAVSLALAGIQTSADAQSRPRQDRNRISEAEIRARPSSNVSDLIKSLRPNWLRVRGTATVGTRHGVDAFGQAVAMPVSPGIIVYVDDVPFGTQESLRSMSAEGIESIERLDAMSATQRFGTNHEHGAIMIRRRTR